MKYLSAFTQLSLLSLLQTVVFSQTPGSPPPCAYRTFAQSVDHFGLNNSTFQQRYSIFTDHFKPGGPILFYVGEEGTYLDCANTTIMYWFAQQLGGMAVSMEHRFFGESLPFGNDSWEVENLKLLTLENVMADGVSFVEYLRKTVVGANESKAIIASGSYGAHVVTVMRQMHPDTFHAALASAAPVAGYIKPGFNSSDGHNNDYTIQQFFKASYEGTENIRNAFGVMHNQIRNNNGSIVQKSLGLCTAPPNDETVIATLDLLYDTAITLNLQYDYAIASSGRVPVANSFDKIINASLTSQNPLDILKFGLDTWISDDSLPCVNWTNAAGFPDLLAPGVERKTFNYIGCTYSGSLGYKLGTEKVFAQNSNDLYSYTSQLETCRKTYNATPMTENEVWKRFKISPADIANSTRIIFSNAEYDPISGSAPQSIPLSSDACKSQVFWTNRMGHREDLLAPAEGDKPEVIKTRHNELETFKLWLASCECN